MDLNKPSGPSVEQWFLWPHCSNPLGTSLVSFGWFVSRNRGVFEVFLFVYVSASRHAWFDVIFSGVFEEYGMPGLRRKLDAHLLRTQRHGLNTMNAEMFLSV